MMLVGSGKTSWKESKDQRMVRFIMQALESKAAPPGPESNVHDDLTECLDWLSQRSVDEVSYSECDKHEHCSARQGEYEKRSDTLSNREDCESIH